MKRNIVILAALCLSTWAYAQIDKTVLRTQAEKMAQSVIRQDYTTLVKFTYPKLVELMGGADKMIAVVKEGTAQMEVGGVTFESATIGEPGATFAAGDELHCIVPQTTFLKVPKGKLKVESSLLAITKDKGQHWTFIDAGNLTDDKVRLILPHFNDALKLLGRKSLFLSRTDI